MFCTRAYAATSSLEPLCDYSLLIIIRSCLFSSPLKIMECSKLFSHFKSMSAPYLSPPKLSKAMFVFLSFLNKVLQDHCLYRRLYINVFFSTVCFLLIYFFLTLSKQQHFELMYYHKTKYFVLQFLKMSGFVSLLFASELIKNITTLKQSNYLTCGDFLMIFLWDRKLKAGRYFGIFVRKVQFSTHSQAQAAGISYPRLSSSWKPAHQTFFQDEPSLAISDSFILSL